ncbi:MAG: nucleotidyltransferase [Firmicutes bacterium]|nr:nucleotidyltransferase [Bacillota bacterium]
MKEKTLVVMAAGMGSRFGGPKQITPIDESENFIIDYSVYDAIEAGFKKVVFIIREEFDSIFKTTIGKRLEGKIKVEYAYQKIDDIPVKLKRINERQKPWGTVQAVLAAKPYVDGDFIIINADDFYGRNAYIEAYNFLENDNKDYSYACIGYEFSKSTVGTETVKRGILDLDGDVIKSIIESSIEQKDGKIIAHPLNGNEDFEIKEDTLVSMNLFAFKNDLFELLDNYFNDFFKQDEDTVLKSEVLLPECLKDNIQNKTIKIISKNSNSKWLGMTYREDLEMVSKSLKKMREDGQYPINLWK